MSGSFSNFGIHEPPRASGSSDAPTQEKGPCEIAAAIASPAPVAEASASQAVSPAISPAISLPSKSLSPSRRESTRTETQRPQSESKCSNQSGDKSGSQSQKLKPNCYECRYRNGVPGSAHSSCDAPGAHARVYPHLKATSLMMLASLIRGASKVERGVLVAQANTVRIGGDVHGIRNGWFNWPLDFDPVWLSECSLFEPRAAIAKATGAA